MRRRIAGCWLAVLALTLMSCRGAPGDLAAAPTEAAAGPQLPPVLQAFAERTGISRAQIPELVKSADQAADRLMAAPLSLVNVPYGPQQCQRLRGHSNLYRRAEPALAALVLPLVRRQIDAALAVYKTSHIRIGKFHLRYLPLRTVPARFRSTPTPAGPLLRS